MRTLSERARRFAHAVQMLSAAEEAELEAAGREESLDAPKPKTPIDIFMASLLDCASKRKCDELAEEFVLKHGDKKG